MAQIYTQKLAAMEQQLADLKAGKPPVVKFVYTDHEAQQTLKEENDDLKQTIEIYQHDIVEAQKQKIEMNNDSTAIQEKIKTFDHVYLKMIDYEAAKAEILMTCQQSLREKDLRLQELEKTINTSGLALEVDWTQVQSEQISLKRENEKLQAQLELMALMRQGIAFLAKKKRGDGSKPSFALNAARMKSKVASSK